MALPKAKDRLRGKQPKLKPTREAQLMALWQAGNHTTLAPAGMFDVAGSNVYRSIQRAGVAPVAGTPAEAAPSAAVPAAVE